MNVQTQKYPNKLRWYRKQAGFTQLQVIENLGLQSTNRLCRWEHGKALPSLINALKLAKLYQSSIEAFYS